MRHCRQNPSHGGGVLLLLLPLLLLTLRCGDAQPSQPSSDNNSSNNNNNLYGFPRTFNPSIAIVIVVLIGAFFFLGFFSIYIRQCGGGDHIGSIRGGIAARSRRNRGLDPELLATFPTLVYSEVKGLKIGKATLECAVCLSEFEDDETLRLLPRCSHVFHPDCIDAWLASHVTCPVCRSNLAAPDNADPAGTPAAAGTLVADSSAEEPVQATEEREEQRPGQSPPPEHVVIAVDEGVGVDRKKELAELARIGNRMRAAGSRRGARPPRFQRSHSTGHSLTLVHDNHDRFTLRLPDHVRQEIVATVNLKRSATTRGFPADLEGSSRRGYRGGGAGGEGSSRAGRSVRLGRSDRWPSFLARTISARFSAFASGKRWDGEGSVKKGEGDGSTRGKLSSVRPQVDRLSGDGGGVKSDLAASNDESSTVARV